MNKPQSYYHINCKNDEELNRKFNDFVLNQLDRRETSFGVIIEGDVLKDKSSNYLMNEDTRFGKKVFDMYYGMEGRDYNALLIKGYSVYKSVSFYRSDPDKPVKFQCTYNVDFGETFEETKIVYEYAKSCVKNNITENMGNYKRLKVLHDIVVNQYKYDTSVDFDYNNSKRFPYQMIVNKTGICSAYSGLIWQLYNAAGYKCRIILQDSYSSDNGKDFTEHAWNMVEVNKNWYHVDATWDDPLTFNGTDMLMRSFFLRGDSYISKTHKWSSLYQKAEKDYRVPLLFEKDNDNLPKRIFSPVYDPLYKPLSLIESNEKAGSLLGVYANGSDKESEDALVTIPDKIVVPTDFTDDFSFEKIPVTINELVNYVFHMLLKPVSFAFVLLVFACIYAGYEIVSFLISI